MGIDEWKDDESFGGLFFSFPILVIYLTVWTHD